MTTSANQAISTVQVYDYLYKAGDASATNPSPLVNAEIRCTLTYDRATSTSPVTNVAPVTLTTTTDSNGFWSFNLVPNASLNPTGTVYTIQTPYSTYQISVTASPSSQQASSILANAVSTLSPAATGLTGPITVTGNETVTGNLTVSGTSTLGATTTGALTAAAGTFSGDLTIASAFRLLFGAAVAKIVGGATSLSLRNNADTQDNVLITDAGAVTVRNGLTVTAGGATVTAGGLTVSAGSVALPAASIADAALSNNVPLKNAANTFSAQQTISSGGAAITGATSITGNLTHTTAYRARAYGTTTQAVSASTDTKVTLGAKAYDPNTNFSTANSQYTCPVAGYYLCIGVCEFTAGAQSGSMNVAKNGVANSLRGPSLSSTQGLMVSGVLLCAANDTLELHIFTAGAATINNVGTSSPAFEVHYIGS